MSLEGGLLTNEEVKAWLKDFNEKYPDAFKEFVADNFSTDLGDLAISPKLVEISKVFVDEHMTLAEKYQEFVDSVDYGELYNNIVKHFDYLKDGAEYGDWNSGTYGWRAALRETIGYDEYDEMFDGLEWYDCDHLDGAIEAKLDKWYKETKAIEQ